MLCMLSVQSAHSVPDYSLRVTFVFVTRMCVFENLVFPARLLILCVGSKWPDGHTRSPTRRCALQVFVGREGGVVVACLALWSVEVVSVVEEVEIGSKESAVL